MYYRRTQTALHHVTKTIQHVAVTSSSSSSTNHTPLFHDWNIDYHQRIKQQQQLHRLIVRLHPQQQQHEPNKKDTTTTMAIFKILESLWLELTLPFPNTTNTTSIISNLTTGTTTTNSHCSNSTIRLFQHCIFYDLPNCITRIEQAFARGHMELIRGFFLSLLTILLSGLARIHVVLLQLQSTMIVQSIQYLSQLQQTLQLLPINDTNNTNNNNNNNTIPNSSSNMVQALLDQIQHLQQNIYQPLLHRIHRKLTRPYPQQRTTTILPSTDTNTRTTRLHQRTESSVRRLGLKVRHYDHHHQSTSATMNPKRKQRYSSSSSAPPTTSTTLSMATATTDIDDENDDSNNETTTTTPYRISSTTTNRIVATEEMNTISFHHSNQSDDDSTTMDRTHHMSNNNNNNNDDIGEVHCGPGAPPRMMISPQNDSTADSHSILIQKHDDDGIDQNMMAVQQFKRQQRLQKNKKKRSSTTASNGGDSRVTTVNNDKVLAVNTTTVKRKSNADATIPAKTKQKKKLAGVVKDDFFDQLFR